MLRNWGRTNLHRKTDLYINLLISLKYFIFKIPCLNSEVTFFPGVSFIKFPPIIFRPKSKTCVFDCITVVCNLSPISKCLLHFYLLLKWTCYFVLAYVTKFPVKEVFSFTVTRYFCRVWKYMGINLLTWIFPLLRANHKAECFIEITVLFLWIRYKWIF